MGGIHWNKVLAIQTISERNRKPKGYIRQTMDTRWLEETARASAAVPSIIHENIENQIEH